MATKPKPAPKPAAKQPKPASPQPVQFAEVGDEDAGLGLSEEALRPMVARMIGVGLSVEQVSLLLEVPVQRIASEFGAETRRGEAQVNFRVANALYQTATDRTHKSHAVAAIYWTKTRMGWAEAKAPDPSPIPGMNPDGTREALSGEEVRGRFDAIVRPNWGKDKDDKDG